MLNAGEAPEPAPAALQLEADRAGGAAARVQGAFDDEGVRPTFDDAGILAREGQLTNITCELRCLLIAFAPTYLHCPPSSSLPQVWDDLGSWAVEFSAVYPQVR